MSLLDLFLETGKPVELYQFVQGAQSWFFTDGGYSIDKDSITYTPENISRTEIVLSGSIDKAGVTITFERTSDFATQYFRYAAEIPTTLTIFRGQADPAGAVDFDAYWKGRVMASKGNGSSVDLMCESVFTLTRHPGLRSSIEKLCRHVLYDQGCTVNREAYRFDGNVQTVSTDDLTLTFDTLGGAADGYFTAGMVRFGATDSRFIADHTGVELRLTRPFDNLIGNSEVAVYPGCNKLVSTCETKFNNILNHGGFPNIPTSNPFRLTGLF